MLVSPPTPEQTIEVYLIQNLMQQYAPPPSLDTKREPPLLLTLRAPNTLTEPGPLWILYSYQADLGLGSVPGPAWVQYQLNQFQVQCGFHFPLQEPVWIQDEFHNLYGVLKSTKVCMG